MHDQFIKEYKQASSEAKVSFLTHLLHDDKALQLRFLKFIARKPDAHPLPSLQSFAQLAIQSQKEIGTSLQQVDLQYPDWDNYTPSHTGYMKEWEQYEDASQQELQAVIEQYQSAAIDDLIEQNLDRMFAIIFGLFMACRDTHLDDPVGSFESVNEYLIDTLKYSFHELCERIDYAIVSDKLIQDVTILILDYCLQYRADDAAFLVAVQPPIHALVKKLEDCACVLKQMERTDEMARLLPRVYSSILQGSGDQKKWLAFAKKTAFLDPEIGKDLLQSYHNEKKQKPFSILARKLFYADKHQWASFLQPLLNLKRDKSLYLEVHLHLIKSESNFEMYQSIRPELSIQQVNKLVDEIWDMKFMVLILESEKRYEDIKQLVRKNNDHYSFSEIITPILNIYPKYCFQILKRLIYKQLDNERGRSAYRRIVKKLILCRQISGYEKSTDKLILDVYQYNSRLSALRDEMRKEGLIES